MKAPDKVYVKKEKNNVVYSLSVQYDNGGEEYIRKDALLEWLKKEIAFYPDEIYSNDHYEDGAKEALQGVIDKLNEM